MKEDEPLTFKGGFKSFLFTMVIIAFVFGMLWGFNESMNDELDKIQSYCYSIGWEYEYHLMNRYEHCYKLVPHESGVGFEKVFSGKIDLEDIE